MREIGEPQASMPSPHPRHAYPTICIKCQRYCVTFYAQFAPIPYPLCIVNGRAGRRGLKKEPLPHTSSHSTPE